MSFELCNAPASF
jgi:hypothetical protein